MNDLYFALQFHDALTSLGDTVCWFEKEEKRKTATLYAMVRLIFSNGVKREKLLSELRETFEYSSRSATRILNPLFKSPVVKQTPTAEQQLNNKRGRPKKGGRPKKKRGRQPGVYEFKKAVPAENLPKPPFEQIFLVCLYNRDLLEYYFNLPFTLHPSYRDIVVKALTDCGCKDIYEYKLSNDDLIVDPRYGMGCLLLTFFKLCDKICEKWCFT